MTKEKLTKEEKIKLAFKNAPDDSEINYDDIPKLTDEQLKKFKPAKDNPKYSWLLKKCNTKRTDGHS